MPARIAPASFEEAAASLAEAAQGGRSVRISGGGSKQGWGSPGEPPGLELSTGRLNRIVEHNQGDFTAVLEAGVPLARAQRQFAAAGQMLALDPFLGSDHRATIGGIIATGDSGPLRHRYGAARDLVLGMTVALSDGTIARSGGKVIKNVAGYDLGKLFCGSFGTLGLILSVSVRLHPLPDPTATTLGVASNPEILGRAAVALSAAPLELEALDAAWHGGRGGILARFAGPRSAARAKGAAGLMRDAGLGQVEIAEDDAGLWARQRAGQRSAERMLVGVASRPSALPQILGAVDACAGILVARAGLGQAFVELEAEDLPRFEEHLPAGARRLVLDAPRAARESADAWGPPSSDRGLELMRSVKARFDPLRACNPGVFVAGI